MKALVIIPTTSRPVVVTALRERPGLPASLVVAEGDFRALPISADYDKLIGAAGPLGHLTGQPGLPSHELRLSEGFETGRSWEVPVCLAHYVTSRGASLVKTPEEADLIVWATGAVDIDLGIVKDRYFLGKKLEMTLPLLERMRRDARFEMFVPEGSLDGMGDPGIYKKFADAGVNSVEVRTVRDAVEWVEPFLADRLGGTPPQAFGAGSAPARPAGKTAAAPSAATVAAPLADAEAAAGSGNGLRLVGALMIAAALAAAGWLWASGRIPGMRPSGSATQVAIGNPSTIKPGTGDTKPDSAGTATTKGDPKADQKAPSVPPPADPKVQPKQAPKVGDGSTAAQPKVINPNAMPSNVPEPVLKDGEVPEHLQQQAAAEVGADLLVIEEQRAPQGLTCRHLAFGNNRPEIALLRAKDGRFPASDVEGLCALIFRRGPGGAAFGIEIEEPLLKATVDAARFGRGLALKTGDVGRMLRDDFRRPISYNVILRPSGGAAGAAPVRYVHELRK